MYELAGKIGMASVNASGVETVGADGTGNQEQGLNTPKAKGYLTKRRITNVVFTLVNVAILIIHSLVVVWGDNPGVNTKVLNNKYPQFLDIITAHKSHGDEDAKKCVDEATCKLSLSDLVGNRTIYPTSDKTVNYEDQTLWNYYLNTVIRNKYEKVDSTTGKCLTGVCGDDKTNDGTVQTPCKWCDFHFGNSTTSYSIKECDDNIKDRRRIYVANMILHLVVVVVCGVLLAYMPKEEVLETYIRCLIWLTASLYLLGNFGYLSIMLVKDHDAHNICAEILTGRTVRGGAISYIVLSGLYFIVTLILIATWKDGKTVTVHRKSASVAYALMPRV
tara:strand:- start:1044 stop:2042 length:999 start_codon:yes stop_codon:yes gene_type:complete